MALCQGEGLWQESTTNAPIDFNVTGLMLGLGCRNLLTGLQISHRGNWFIYCCGIYFPGRKEGLGLLFWHLADITLCTFDFF